MLDEIRIFRQGARGVLLACLCVICEGFINAKALDGNRFQEAMFRKYNRNCSLISHAARAREQVRKETTGIGKRGYRVSSLSSWKICRKLSPDDRPAFPKPGLQEYIPKGSWTHLNVKNTIFFIFEGSYNHCLSPRGP